MIRHLALASALWVANCVTPVIGQDNRWVRHVDTATHFEFCWPKALFDDVIEHNVVLQATYHGGGTSEDTGDGAVFTYFPRIWPHADEKEIFVPPSPTANVFSSSTAKARLQSLNGGNLLMVMLRKPVGLMSNGRRFSILFSLMIHKGQQEKWQPLIDAIKRGLPCDSSTS